MQKEYSQVLKVFDVSLYEKLSPEIKKASVTEDLAGLVIEAGATSLEARINPRQFQIVNGEVFDSVSGKNPTSNLNENSDLAKKESQAARKFFSNFSKNNISVWISPPGGEFLYSEARFVFGYRYKDTIKYYPVPSRMSSIECLQNAKNLNRLSINKQIFTHPEDLRSVVFGLNLPENINPWIYLSSIVSLDSDPWSEILKGTPWKIKRKALKNALEIYEMHYKSLTNASNETDYIAVGAQLETGMQEMGWSIDSYACPGSTNTQLTSLNMFGQSFAKDSFGNWRNLEIRSLKCKCGICNKKVEAKIYGGFIHCPACKGSAPYKC